LSEENHVLKSQNKENNENVEIYNKKIENLESVNLKFSEEL